MDIETLLTALTALHADLDDMQIVLMALPTQPERPLIPDIRFDLLSMADANAEAEFRFDSRGIIALARVFALPEYIITTQRDKAHSTEAMCILLARLSYPKRQYDMTLRFGRAACVISRLVAHMGTLNSSARFTIAILTADQSVYCTIGMIA